MPPQPDLPPGAAFRRGVACSLALAASACAPGPREAGVQRPNVLLVSIDSLRADHLSCYGYERETSPSIDRLAREGVLFENAVSSSSWTLPAHAAVFTALPDSIHRVERPTARLVDEHRTLAEALKAEGYHTAGFWSGPFLDPVFGLGQGFDEYVDCRTPFELEGEPEGSAEGDAEGDPEGGRRQRAINDASHHDVTGPRLLAAVSEWMDERLAEPFFLFVHMWDVHYDYIPPPPYDRLFDPDYDGPADGRDVGETLDPGVARDLEHTIALYDGEIAWTDLHVGKLLELLEQHGLERRTVVVLTADHGEEFWEHGAFGHRKTLFEESIRIPLILRLPDGARAGTRERRAVGITDIAPTILELTGSAPLEDVLGEPLLPPHAASAGKSGVAVSDLRNVRVDRERGPLFSLRGEDWKLLVRRRDGEPYRLFDLGRDPGEQHDLLGDDSELRGRALAELARVQALLAELRARHRRDAADGRDEHELSEELEAELRSLGYIGDE